MKKLIPLLCFLLAGFVYIGCSEELATQVTPDQETSIVDNGFDSPGDELFAGAVAKRGGGGKPGSTEIMHVAASGAIAYGEHSFEVSKNTDRELALHVSQPASFTNFATNFSGFDLEACAINPGRGGKGTPEAVANLAELVLNVSQASIPVVSAVVHFDKRSDVSSDHKINVQFDPDGNGTVIIGLREADDLLPGVYPKAVFDEENSTITYSGGAVHVWSRQGKVKDNFSFACENLDMVVVSLRPE